MAQELTEKIQIHSLSLRELIEPGCGFRVGSPDATFAVVDQNENQWTYTDPAHELRVESEVSMNGGGIVIGHQLYNDGAAISAPIQLVEPLYLVFRQPEECWRHIYANGGTLEWYYPPLAYRTQEKTRTSTRWLAGPPALIESHPLGLSSGQHLPLLISLASIEPSSDGLFCGLEWTGGWYMRWGLLEGGRSYLAIGVKVNGIRLEPGERLKLPNIHLGFFSGGPAAGTNALRKYLYEQVCARYHGELMIPRASYSHWYSIENQFNIQLLKTEARRAAELGLEFFAVDAGWFPGDWEGIGNWDRVDARKFPNGIEPLSQFVRELGMGFGMWFEPERAVEGTTAVKEHPEWYIQVPSWGQNPFYHLNLAIREAQDYVIDMIGRWIERAGLQWSRYDYNIVPQLNQVAEDPTLKIPRFWEAVDPTLKIQFAYFEGLYRVLDTLMAKYPDWIVEGCAGGGRRIDIATMKRAHTFWFSDQAWDPWSCRYMQARANRFLPGHLLNSTIVVKPGAGDAGYDDVAVLSRMLGKLQIDGDIASWSPELTKRMARWVGQFKAIRHLFVQDFYQLLPIPTTVEDWDAVQFVSYTGDEAVVFVFSGSAGSKKIRLCGLQGDRQYHVTHLLDGGEQPVLGSALLSEGLEVELGFNQAGLWRITKDNSCNPMEENR